MVTVKGCADFSAPDNARVLRQGDTIQVACNFTDERWHLVCKGNEWIGTFGNCSETAVHGRTEHGIGSTPRMDVNERETTTNQKGRLERKFWRIIISVSEKN
jgi:hypothetical protein